MGSQIFSRRWQWLVCFDVLNFEELVPAIAELAPGKMRGERYVWRGALILNDGYNSNPEAVRCMMDVLKG